MTTTHMATETKHRRIRSLLLKHGGLCADCGCRIAETGYQIHHVVPKSQGGSDRLDNLILLCPNCHAARHR